MVKVEVWGDYACFTRPELKVERVSYEIITPSAARGILEAIYWHPGMKWIIDKIYLLSPICIDDYKVELNDYGVAFMNLKRNELKSKVNSQTVLSEMENGMNALYCDPSEDRTQRSSLVLRGVHYVVEAHFDMTDKATDNDNPAKFQEMFLRRLRKGQCFHTPYFGCREFPVNFREWIGEEHVPSLDVTRDLGYMLYDMDYLGKSIEPTFFKAKLEKGVMDLTNCEVYR